MRYALRNQNKIAAAYGADYLQQNLINSLNRFFETVDEDALNDYWVLTVPGEPFPILRINDMADDNCMVEFAVINKQYDVLQLAYIGRMKG